METKKRILVIDDELNGRMERKSHYKKALEEKYNVIFAEDDRLIYHTIKNSQAELFIVDLNLDKFTDPKKNRSLYVGDVLDAIGKNKPIILISGAYEDLAKNGDLTCMINNAAEQGFNVGSFLTWQDILDASEKQEYKEALSSKIDFAINRDRSPYDFAIVCALQEELTPFNDILGEDNIPIPHTVDDIHYIINTLTTKSGRILKFIAASSSYMGIADSSIIATHLASKMGVKNIYMIGVCGGRESEKVNIGDLIIPEESVAFQRGKLRENGFSPDIQIAKSKFGGYYKDEKTNDILSSLFTKYISKIIKEENRTLDLTIPRVHYEPMACADYVIDKPGALDEIAEKSAKRKICAVDMESYAIYRVGEIMNVNTMVIKSVMDLTNKKSDKYKPYAAYISANYLFELLYREIIKL